MRRFQSPSQLSIACPSSYLAACVILFLATCSVTSQQIIVRQLSDAASVSLFEFGLRVFRVDSVTLVSSGSHVSTNNGATWRPNPPIQTPDGDAFIQAITSDGTFWYSTGHSAAFYRTRLGSTVESILPPPGSTFVQMLGFDRYILKDENDVFSLVRGNDTIVLPSTSKNVPYSDGTTWVAGGKISWDDAATWTEFPNYKLPPTQFGGDLRFLYLADQRHVLMCGNIGDGRYVGSQYAVKFNKDGSVVQHKGDHGSEDNRTGGYYTWSHQFQNGPLVIGSSAKNYTYSYDDTSWFQVGDADRDEFTSVASSSEDEVLLWVTVSGLPSPTLWSVKYTAITEVSDSQPDAMQRVVYDQGSLVIKGQVDPSSTHTYVIYNVQGVTVSTCVSNSNRIACGPLASGIYFVSVDAGAKVFRVEVVN